MINYITVTGNFFTNQLKGLLLDTIDIRNRIIRFVFYSCVRTFFRQINMQR